MVVGGMSSYSLLEQVLHNRMVLRSSRIHTCRVPQDAVEARCHCLAEFHGGARGKSALS